MMRLYRIMSRVDLDIIVRLALIFIGGLYLMVGGNLRMIMVIFLMVCLCLLILRGPSKM